MAFKQELKFESNGFTLAEVLITLGIIGVVAALTIPALIKKYQEIVTIEKLKKVYTTMAQVDVLAKNEYGEYLTCPNENCNPASNNEFLNTLIFPYI